MEATPAMFQKLEESGGIQSIDSNGKIIFVPEIPCSSR
jgi:hypothetical protein